MCLGFLKLTSCLWDLYILSCVSVVHLHSMEFAYIQTCMNIAWTHCNLSLLSCWVFGIIKTSTTLNIFVQRPPTPLPSSSPVVHLPSSGWEGLCSSHQLRALIGAQRTAPAAARSGLRTHGWLQRGFFLFSVSPVPVLLPRHLPPDASRPLGCQTSRLP